MTNPTGQEFRDFAPEFLPSHGKVAVCGRGGVPALNTWECTKVRDARSYIQLLYARSLAYECGGAGHFKVSGPSPHYVS